nr:hypothetical protein GCM10010200_054220 [Actinomadura rugatobispora]
MTPVSRPFDLGRPPTKPTTPTKPQNFSTYYKLIHPSLNKSANRKTRQGAAPPSPQAAITPKVNTLPGHHINGNASKEPHHKLASVTQGALTH